MRPQRIEWVLWICLVAVVGYLALSQRQESGHLTDPGERPDFLLMSRQLVGLNHVFAKNMPGKTDLLAQLRDLADTDALKLRLAVVLGEVEGPKQALAELEHLNLPVAATLQVLYRDGPAALPVETQQGLTKELGWYGELALVHNKTNQDATRKAVLAPALRVQVVTTGLVLLGGVAFVLGAALLVGGFVALKSGKLQILYPQDIPLAPSHGTVFLEVTILALSSMGLMASLAQLLGAWSVALTQFSLVVWLGWAVMRGVPADAIRQTLGWVQGSGWLRETGWGILGYLAGLPILVSGLMVTALLSRFSDQMASHPVSHMIEGATPGFIVYLLMMACVVAPLIEETLFRGALYGYFRSRCGAMLSGFLQGLIFAAIHPQGWIGIPVLTSLGLVFGLIREWRGSLVACVVAHGLNNGMVLGLSVALLR